MNVGLNTKYEYISHIRIFVSCMSNSCDSMMKLQKQYDETKWFNILPLKQNRSRLLITCNNHLNTSSWVVLSTSREAPTAGCLGKGLYHPC